jgi:gamma-D-glutamyl-L-lysine dipeptidyl-peptidase
MTTYVISVGVADVRRDPDPSSELVTQALMNTPVILGENAGEWKYITLTDYTGWVRTDELEEPIVKGFCKLHVHPCTYIQRVTTCSATSTFQPCCLCST